MAEVAGSPGVGRGSIGLIRLWKYVEKPEEPASKGQTGHLLGSWHMESERYTQPAFDVSNRYSRTRNLRSEFRKLPL